MNPATGTDLASAIGYVVAGFTASAVIIGLLMRLLFGSYKKQAEQRDKVVNEKLNSLSIKIDAVEQRMQKAIEEAVRDGKDAEERANKSIEKMEQSIEKVRDKWERFQADYNAMETTRGNRVRALFRVYDELREAFQGLKPALFNKIDDVMQEGMVELKKIARENKRES